jgi:pimeloyl-ACP methyl ester carboxylesterase
MHTHLHYLPTRGSTPRDTTRRGTLKLAAGGSLAALLAFNGLGSSLKRSARATSGTEQSSVNDAASFESYAVNPEDGLRIYFAAEGSGAPLVLFHGSASSSDLWRGLGYVDDLQGDYQLILIDARGHGRSGKPHEEDAYAMRLLVGDVVAVLDTLDIEQAHFLGYSFGGRVGFGIAKYAPERFASLVIGGGSYRAVPGFMDRIAYPGALELLANEGMEAFLAEWERRLGAPLPAGLRAAYLGNDVDALVAYFRRSDHEPSVEDALPDLQTPVLLFVGKNDRERFADSHHAAGLLPNVTFAVIPHENHVSTLTHKDLVLPQVTAFLNRVTAPQTEYAAA